MSSHGCELSAWSSTHARLAHTHPRGGVEDKAEFACAVCAGWPVQWSLPTGQFTLYNPHARPMEADTYVIGPAVVLCSACTSLTITKRSLALAERAPEPVMAALAHAMTTGGRADLDGLHRLSER